MLVRDGGPTKRHATAPGAIFAPLSRLQGSGRRRLKKMGTSEKADRRALDATDRAIAHMLQADGRRSFADIAGELGLAPSTVQQRANRMFRSGVIRIMAAVDPVAFGVPVLAQISVKADETRLREVGDEIARFEEVGYLAISTGRNDLIIEIACRDNDHLLSFVTDKLAKVTGVRDSETSLYLKIVKNSIQWGVP